MLKKIFNIFKKKPKKQEPYFNIVSDEIDPVQGIKITLDWNDEFITYLKSNGYTGTADEVIIQKWLSDISKQVAENVATNVVSAYE